MEKKLKFITFKKAQSVVRSQKFNCRNEFNSWKLRPADIPATPASVYKSHGFTSWGDFLGHGRIANQNREFLSFDEARDFIRSKKLKSSIEFRNWTTRPSDIPANPARTYKKDGWISFDDFLGHGRISNVNRKFITFKKARSVVRAQKFNCRNEFFSWKDKPNSIPMAASSVYKDRGFISWGDFLGHGRIANQRREFHSFEEARKAIRKLNFNSRNEYLEWTKTSKRPSKIPAAPDYSYAKKGWTTWGDFLGKNKK